VLWTLFHGFRAKEARLLLLRNALLPRFQDRGEFIIEGELKNHVSRFKSGPRHRRKRATALMTGPALAVLPGRVTHAPSRGDEPSGTAGASRM
jgi:hypothetical protein